MAERIEVFTENYEEMYGHKPKGQGTWAFFIVSSRGTDFNEPIISTACTRRQRQKLSEKQRAP